MVYTKGSALITRIRDDLASVMPLFSGAYVVFSDICEHRVWMRGTCDAPGRLYKSRINVNKVGGSILRHMGMIA